MPVRGQGLNPQNGRCTPIATMLRSWHMGEPSQNLTIKLDLDIAVGSERKLRAQIQLEGDADIISRASSAVTSTLMSVVHLPASPPVIAASVSTPELTIAPISTEGVVPVQPATPVAATPVAATPGPRLAPKAAPVLLSGPVALPKPTPAAASVHVAPSTAFEIQDSHRQSRGRTALAQRDWSKFSLSFGALLVVAALVVAVVFPPLVPREQRLEVFMMSLAFGLLGTLALYSGALPGKGDSDQASETQLERRSPQTLRPHPNTQTLAMQRAAFLRTRDGHSAGSWLWGMAFGVVFVLAGVIAPFALGTGNADERFLMMLGFAPVAAIGVLLIVIFWRRMQNPARFGPSSTRVATPAVSRTTRKSVPRAPSDPAFRMGVPAALATLGILLLLVIGLVVVATLIPMLR